MRTEQLIDVAGPSNDEEGMSHLAESFVLWLYSNKESLLAFKTAMRLA
jgi:hypothetical protein